jgi:hypothetical protein
VLDRGLTRLINESTKRTSGPEPLPWAIIGVAAYLLRRSLRQTPEVQRFTVRSGDDLTISLRDPDD